MPGKHMIHASAEAASLSRTLAFAFVFLSLLGIAGGKYLSTDAKFSRPTSSGGRTVVHYGVTHCCIETGNSTEAMIRLMLEMIAIQHSLTAH